MRGAVRHGPVWQGQAGYGISFIFLVGSGMMWLRRVWFGRAWF
jgi:hypothetical protein